MIKKPFEVEFHQSVIGQAGFKVARRTAKLINKTFENFSDVYVLHNIFIDSENIIDHIILYKNAIILIESRTCHGSIRVNDNGLWTRERMGIVNPIQSVRKQKDALSEKISHEASRFIPAHIISDMVYYQMIVKSEQCIFHGNNPTLNLILSKDQLISQIDTIINSTDSATRKKLWRLRNINTPSAEDLEALTSFIRNEHYRNIPPE